MSAAKYERWIWIELIGFDNTQPDCGAEEYLDRLGFVPDSLSYLITAPDIIHHHAGLETEVEFPPDYCSYCGHDRNAERERQVWTNHQLKTLTTALQSRGIKVFLATFTFWLHDRFHPEWVGEHQELLETRRNGEPITALQPLKRFADGSLYEDFFIPQLERVLTDYDFDGWHAADGWGPARLPIYEADYSNDMFEQFVQARGIEVPGHIVKQCAATAEYEARADWIWREQRREWMEFYTDRWASFFRKKVAMVHGLGKQVVVNSTWTRDPFEAIYRYGVDYRKIIVTGVDGIVTESAAGAADMESESGFRLDNYVGALLLIRAAVPNTRLVFLHGVKDTKEQWDLIHHAPTILEKETLSLANIYLHDEGAKLTRCANGLVVCLGDGIVEEEWQWLQSRWKLAFGEVPENLLGATLVWSDCALENELNDFSYQRGWTTHRLLYKLTEQGAPIQSVVRIENLENARGAILVLNAHFLPPNEMEQVRTYTGGPVITIGRKENSSKPILTCNVISGKHNTTSIEDLSDNAPLPDPLNIEEPITFLKDLVMNELGENFVKDCACLISETSCTVQIASGEEFVSLQAMELENKKVRVIVKNSRLSYANPTIETGRALASVEVLSEFPCAQIHPVGSQFNIKVPGRGATVVELGFEDGGGSS